MAWVTWLLCAAAVAGLRAACTSDSQIFDVRDFGAAGDGKTLDTKAFEQAVLRAHAHFRTSGSIAVVLAKGGDYLSGQITLLSGVWLSVSSSARLLASTDVKDYPQDQAAWAFIWANGSSNIGVVGDLLAERSLWTSASITSGGTLDGGYRAFVTGFEEEKARYSWRGWPQCTGECRPRLVKFLHSSDITVAGVTLQGSPDWTLHLWGCTRATVRYLRQLGDERWPNNDGIDIDSSQHVLVADSSFDTADDGVCIKSTAGMQDTFNLTVRNVSIRSRSGAVKVGSATPVPIHDLLFEDIYVWDSHRGLAIQQRDGADVYNVLFRNCVVNGTRLWPMSWWGGGEPIYLSNMPRSPSERGGRMRNISFVNVTAASQNAAVLSGLQPGRPLEGVALTDVAILIDRRPAWNYTIHSTPAVPPTLDYEPSSAVAAERVSMAGWQPGLYVEGVRGLTLNRVSVRFNNHAWQDAWGHECFNMSRDVEQVTSSGVSCSPPRPPAVPGASVFV